MDLVDEERNILEKALCAGMHVILQKLSLLKKGIQDVFGCLLPEADLETNLTVLAFFGKYRQEK